MKTRPNFTWAHLGKGILGSLVGASVEGVGIGVSALIRSPRATFHTIKGLWKTKTLGPVLKSTCTPLVIVTGTIAPIIGILGGISYGIYEGFSKGSKENPLSSYNRAIKTIKKFHFEIVDNAIEEITKISIEKHEQFYEIKIIEAIKGLFGGILGGGITGIGVAISTTYNVPVTYFKISREIWRDNIIFPFATGCQILITLFTIITIPLFTVLGIVAGLGIGAYRAYSKGFLVSIIDCLDDVKKYHEFCDKIIYARV